MEEFDREEFRAQLQKAAASEEYQKMLQTMSKAMEELGKSLAMVAEKLAEVVNNIDWDAIIKVLMEGKEENVLEDYIRSRQRKRMRDAYRHRRGDRPRGRGRDWRRAELPAQKSYVRRWKLRASRPRRDFRRRRT
jgi:hypothetical protein